SYSRLLQKVPSLSAACPGGRRERQIGGGVRAADPHAPKSGGGPPCLVSGVPELERAAIAPTLPVATRADVDGQTSLVTRTQGDAGEARERADRLLDPRGNIRGRTDIELRDRGTGDAARVRHRE